MKLSWPILVYCAVSHLEKLVKSMENRRFISMLAKGRSSYLPNTSAHIYHWS